MKTLLAIISTERDNELVRRHWRSFKKTGWDILGAGEVSGKCQWPGDVHRLDTGVLGVKAVASGTAIYGLLQQELDIWKWFLDHKEYDSVCVIEADNYFVRKPPEHPGNGLYVVTILPNYAKPGLFRTPVYFSTPRWADRKCAEQLHAHGTHMYNRGDVEHYISDRWPALICTLGRIPWIAQPGWSPSAFHWGVSNQNEAWVRDARAAIQLGCYVLHSVKHQWQLDAIKDLVKI